MTVRYIGVFLLAAAVVVAPAVIRADPENYPRACIDASAVVDAARAYSKSSSTYTWDAKKLATAYSEYQACISAAADAKDLGYAVTGMIYVDLLGAAFYREMARSAALPLNKETPTQQRQFFENMKALALAQVADARRLIDKANGPRSGLDADTMATIDKQYEDYKKSHAQAAAITYDDSVRFVAQLRRSAPKPKPSASPARVEETESIASSEVTCDPPSANAQVLSAAHVDLPLLAAQQGIRGDVVVEVNLAMDT